MPTIPSHTSMIYRLDLFYQSLSQSYGYIERLKA